MDEHTDKAHPNGAQTRVTVAEAAQLLGLSAEAVRSRVQRGTLESTKEKGTVYVLLDADQASPKRRPNGDEEAAQTDARTHLGGDQARYIDSLEGQVEWLRREVERKDTIIMQMAQANAALAAKVPELEAPPEPRESDVSASEGRGGADVPPEGQDREQPVSWWRKLLSG